MKVLVFGSNGQDGFYLSELCNSKGVEFIGVSRQNATLIGSVADFELVKKTIKFHQPDWIIHLAANSTTRHDALWDNHNAISTGSLNILEAVKLISPKTKVFLSGSALQFLNEEKPIDESTPLVATSPYVVSRNQSLFAARYYRSLGLQVYFGYFFNHDSPRRPNRHMAQKIAHYCRNISNEKEPLQVGAVDVKKEWTFAGDTVNAIWKLISQDEVYECIIGSGRAYSIEDWLEVCFSLIDKNWKDFVKIKEGFIPEYNILISNPQRLLSLGWEQKVGFKKLAKMMMNDE